MTKPSEAAMAAADKWFGTDPAFNRKHRQQLARIIDEAYAPLRGAANLQLDGAQYGAARLAKELARATPKEPT